MSMYSNGPPPSVAQLPPQQQQYAIAYLRLATGLGGDTNQSVLGRMAFNRQIPVQLADAIGSFLHSNAATLADLCMQLTTAYQSQYGAGAQLDAAKCMPFIEQQLIVIGTNIFNNAKRARELEAMGGSPFAGTAAGYDGYGQQRASGWGGSPAPAPVFNGERPTDIWNKPQQLDPNNPAPMPNFADYASFASGNNNSVTFTKEVPPMVAPAYAVTQPIDDAPNSPIQYLKGDLSDADVFSNGAVITLEGTGTFSDQTGSYAFYGFEFQPPVLSLNHLLCYLPFFGNGKIDVLKSRAFLEITYSQLVTLKLKYNQLEPAFDSLSSAAVDNDIDRMFGIFSGMPSGQVDVIEAYFIAHLNRLIKNWCCLETNDLDTFALERRKDVMDILSQEDKSDIMMRYYQNPRFLKRFENLVHQTMKDLFVRQKELPSLIHAQDDPGTFAVAPDVAVVFGEYTDRDYGVVKESDRQEFLNRMNEYSLISITKRIIVPYINPVEFNEHKQWVVASPRNVVESVCGIVAQSHAGMMGDVSLILPSGHDRSVAPTGFQQFTVGRTMVDRLLFTKV